MRGADANNNYIQTAFSLLALLLQKIADCVHHSSVTGFDLSVILNKHLFNIIIFDQNS